jgi:hypothetical protein
MRIWVESGSVPAEDVVEEVDEGQGNGVEGEGDEGPVEWKRPPRTRLRTKKTCGHSNSIAAGSTQQFHAYLATPKAGGRC